MKRICGIYKITSLNGRVYIGQSAHISKRKDTYKYGSCKSQKRLYSSILKYGWETHSFEIVEECPVEHLNSRERYWQDFYNVLSENGLNCVLQNCTEKRKVYIKKVGENISRANVGRKRTDTVWNKGKKLPRLSEEHKNKISIGNKGKIVTKETCLKISVSNMGRIISAESRKKMSESHKGMKASLETRLKLSKLHLGKKKSESHRRNISLGRKGYTWPDTTREKFIKPVLQFTKDLIFIKEWSSGKDAQEALKISRCHIASCCTGKRKIAGGYIWKHKNAEDAPAVL